MSETSRKLAAYEDHPRTPEYAALRFGMLEPHVTEAPDDGTYYLNMGPHHPSTHGVLRLVLRLDGEKVVECEPVIGYSHRGHEKMAERGLYSQFLPNPSRMDYLGGMIYNVGYCQAVERAFDIEVPERALYIRTLVSEFNRVTSHLLWFGAFLMDLGAFTPFLLAFQDRENILDLLDSVTGSRLTYCYAYFGGVTWDLPDDFDGKARALIAQQRESFTTYHKLVTGNTIFRKRTDGVGIITPEIVHTYAMSGPTARASGISYDVRRAEPYGAYPGIDFEVPTRTEGDCLARYLVRFDEMEQSLRIVEQCLDKMPGGAFGPAKPMIRVKAKPGTYYHTVESPRGQLGFFIMADKNPEPWRIKARTPSFCNLNAMAKVLEGTMIADTIAILGSIDVVMPEIDR
jgi:NADH-quinone oxidoreductase subunit D